MIQETTGITPAMEGMDGVHWNVLGQIYTPKQISDDCFSWHATFPIETFVPPHIHADQDEYIFMLDGALDLLLDGEHKQARSGDLIRMPRTIPHGIFNNSGSVVTCLFWVTPAAQLFELFQTLHNVASTADAVRISAQYNVEFLPPKAA